jgi:hypothetical protein
VFDALMGLLSSCPAVDVGWRQGGARARLILWCAG